jgi:hypothetical protein
MKVTVKENQTFKPITIELVVNTEQELCDLAMALNINRNVVNKVTLKKFKFKFRDTVSELRQKILKLTEKYDL